MPISRAAALLALAVVLPGCGGDRDTPPQERSAAGRVGVVLGTPPAADLAPLQGAIRSALDEQGQELVVQDAGGDPARQRQLVETFTSQGARAIVTVPLDSVTLQPAIAAADAAGIPVFTIGSPVPEAKVTTHMDADFHAAGLVAAEYIGAFLGPRFRAAVVGRLGAHGSRVMEAAFRTSLVAVQTRVLSGSANTEGSRESAAAATAGLLERDPRLDAIFALDPLSALGAMDAAYARRRADLVIVSFGATPEVLAAIGNVGPMRGAVVQRLDEGARLLAEAIATQLDGEPVTPSIKVPVRLVTADSTRR